MDRLKEEYRDVIGYEGYYQISNCGTVKSMDRYINYRYGKRLKLGKVLKDAIQPTGYKSVSLSKDGKTKTKLIHRLVAQAYLPNPLGKKQVNHIDFNKTNNSVENLEWSTPKENTLHSCKANRIGGTANYMKRLRKLTDKQIIDIRKGKYSNLNNHQLSRLLNVSRRCLSFVRKGISYKHLSTN